MRNTLTGIVLGLTLTSAALAAPTRKIDRACDKDGSGSISEAELNESKCQRKIVNAMVSLQRELALLGEEGAGGILDEIEKRNESLNAASKAERRAKALQCFVDAAQAVAKGSSITDDIKGVVKSKGFEGCVFLIPEKWRGSAISGLDKTINKRIAKVEAMRGEVTAFVEGYGQDKLEALLLRVASKRASEQAWATGAAGSLKMTLATADTLAAFGKAYTAPTAKNVIAAGSTALAAGATYFTTIKKTVVTAKVARTVACENALAAKAIDGDSKWRPRFVSRCEQQVSGETVPDTTQIK